MRKKLLVSFSGGETSAYMAWWLWTYKRDEYDMIFVFANTGQENEETYQFIERFSKHFEIPIIWIEAKVFHGERRGNGFTAVDFKTADRVGVVFEEIIKKHGIPCTMFSHCTRELKQVPIKKYAQSMWGNDYYTAIGIREDEADRINSKAKELRLIYPLINKGMRPMTKPKINFWWSQQPFRLNLKGYQGNCKTCWKKSDKKLYQIAKEHPEYFEFNRIMESKYDNYVPESRLAKIRERGEEPVLPIRFFRKNRTADDIINESKEWDGSVVDDTQDFDLDGESCEAYSECGYDD